MRRIELFLSAVALTAACGNSPTNPSPYNDAEITDTASDVADDTSDVATSDTSPTDAPVGDAPADSTPSDVQPGDVPVGDVPGSDASADVPVADVPVADVPVADVPVVDVPVVDVPVVDVPAVDVPAVDVPAVDVPAVDVPAVDVPVVDVPVVDVPVVDVVADVIDASIDVSVDVSTDVATDASVDVGVDASPTLPGPLQELWILRVGDGTAALAAASTAVFIERRASTDGTTRAATLNLPIAMTGSNRPITISGTATSEGSFSRASNGRYVTFAGYAAAPGLASVTTSAAATVPRVVARIDATGAIDTATTLGAAFGGGNVRGAVTVDGTAFWIAGTGSPGGVQYQPFHGAAEPASVVAMPSNVRTVGFFGDRLYGSASTSTPAPGFYGVFSVGSAGTQPVTETPATMLPGLPTASGPSPYAFALLDRDTAVAGVDTLYLADDRAIASGGGVQRWNFSGTTWTLGATFNAGITSGVRGVTAWGDGPDVVIAAVTAESASRVVLFRDRPGLPPTAAFPVVTAPANTQFRGVALAPVP